MASMIAIADRDTRHDSELGAPGGQRIPFGNGNGDQDGRTREAAPSRQILGAVGIDRGTQDPAGRTVPPRVQDRALGNRLAGRVPGLRLPEQEKSVGVDQLDDAARTHVDRRIETPQPVGLKGRREQPDEAPLWVAHWQPDWDGHAGESHARQCGSDDQAGTRIVLEPPIEIPVPARRPGNCRIGR
jgi:hypothetical protein